MRADDHAVVGPVPHHLQLVFLPAGDGPLDQDLGDGAGAQTGGGQTGQFVLVPGYAGAGAAQDVGGAHDQRISDPLPDF